MLYAVQGLPFGFQATALPVYLRDEGVSLTGVGLAGAVSVPWMLKALWAPIVDRWTSRRLGRRRSWILPMQLGLAITCVLAAVVSPKGALEPLLLLVLAMNFFAATMDVAVDGLAVDMLAPWQLGRGNIAQVVGYKLGMLTGGGLLVWASESIGWGGLFAAMAALVLAASVVTLFFREPEPRGAHFVPASFREIVATLAHAMRTPGAGWLIAFIATYKLGESMADAMFKPFLVDAGFAPKAIGFWVGTWGMVFSLAGSFVGGVLAGGGRILLAVIVTALARALSIAGEWWLSLQTPTELTVAIVTSFEHFAGGALTTAIFALMMSRTDRRIGATHFTVLATIEVIGKSPSGWLSGIVTESIGYSGTFALATALSVAFIGLVVPLRATEPKVSPAAPT